MDFPLSSPWDQFVGAVECRVGELRVDRWEGSGCPFSLLVAEHLASVRDVERAAWILKRAFDRMGNELEKRLLVALLIELGLGQLAAGLQLTEGLAAAPILLGDWEPHVATGLVVVTPRPSAAVTATLEFSGRTLGVSLAAPGEPTERRKQWVRFAIHEVDGDAFRCAREVIATVTSKEG